jgi:hypothetical protein
MEFTTRELHLIKCAIEHAVKQVDAKATKIDWKQDEPEESHNWEAYETINSTLKGYKKLLLKF